MQLIRPLNKSFASGVAASADGRWLVVPVHESVLLRDMKARAWGARLSHPTELYAPEPVTSADGGWIGAVFQKGTRASGFTHEVVLWNVAEALGRKGEAVSPR